MRQAAYARRQRVHSADASARGVANLLDYLADREFNTVAAYMAIRTEIDPLAAMVELSKCATVCVPVVLGKGQALTFHQWSPEAELVEGPFGVKVPADKVVVVPQVLIVPLLTFDGAGYRLGYGGGFYDRSLQALRARGPVHAIGFAYGGQRVDVVPIEATDQRLDGVVTDEGVMGIAI